MEPPQHSTDDNKCWVIRTPPSYGREQTAREPTTYWSGFMLWGILNVWSTNPLRAIAFSDYRSAYHVRDCLFGRRSEVIPLPKQHVEWP